VGLLFFFGAIERIIFSTSLMSPYDRTYGVRRSILPFIVGGAAHIGISFVLILVYSLIRKPVNRIGLHIFTGLLLGPIALFGVRFCRNTRLRYSFILGFAMWVAVWGIALGTIGIVMSSGFDTRAAGQLGSIITQVIYILSLSFSLAAVTVVLARWRKIPLDERLIASFWEQTRLQFLRSMKQVLFSVLDSW
jgi:hypothetical protein